MYMYISHGGGGNKFDSIHDHGENGRQRPIDDRVGVLTTIPYGFDSGSSAESSIDTFWKSETGVEVRSHDC